MVRFATGSLNPYAIAKASYLAENYPPVAAAVDRRLQLVIARIAQWPNSGQAVAERPGVGVRTRKCSDCPARTNGTGTTRPAATACRAVVLGSPVRAGLLRP